MPPNVISHFVLTFGSPGKKTWLNCHWSVSENVTHLLSPHIPLAELMEIWFHFDISKRVKMQEGQDWEFLRP